MDNRAVSHWVIPSYPGWSSTLYKHPGLIGVANDYRARIKLVALAAEGTQIDHVL